MKRNARALAACLIAFSAVGYASAEGDLRAAIAQDYKDNLGPLFLWFHQHPELSFLEAETSRRLAGELRALGYDVTEGVGGTGVVAVMKNGDGPTVLLRADMDGLPVKEASGLSYASTARQVDIDGIEKPVTHACGHDVHITALVGAARQLAARKSEWAGTLVLVGQPAEERIGGARAMIEDGLYSRFPKPEYAIAFHIAADLPIGHIQVPLEQVASSSDSVDIIVHGVGAHGAYPHMGVDPVLVAAQIVVSLQTLVSRSIAPLEPGVITVGAIHGGFKHNIIGDRVEMQLTVRADDPDVRLELLDGIDRVARGVAISLNVPAELMPEVIRSETETTPPTINDPATAERIRNAFTAEISASVLIDQPRDGMGAEDFAYFVTRESGVKGVYFNVGGTPADEAPSAASHHSPFFKITPEPSVKLGTEAMVIGAMTLLKPEN